MSDHPTDFRGSVTDAIREAIVAQIPGAEVVAQGGGGHFTIEVTSPVFEGKTMVQSHRLVLGSIKHLMAGALAPIHAVDSIKTKTP
jgi:acid stress-induced BolA-like protein IbaG/YrbA